MADVRYVECREGPLDGDIVKITVDPDKPTAIRFDRPGGYYEYNGSVFEWYTDDEVWRQLPWDGDLDKEC